MITFGKNKSKKNGKEKKKDENWRVFENQTERQKKKDKKERMAERMRKKTKERAKKLNEMKRVPE